jgi:peptide/nickel transport system substrate-binding protein
MALYATAIYPKRLAGPKLWSHPIGTGPFTFTSWAKGSEVVLSRNPNFWRKNGQPYLDTYHHLSVPDSNTRTLQVQSGETDIALYASPAIAKSLKGNPSVVVRDDPYVETVFISMNVALSDPPLNNKLVRQALNYAVDKDVIVQKILFGYGKSWGQGLQPMFGADPSIKPYAYDPTKAKALLAQAGHAQGFSCECLIDNSRPSDAQVATLIQQDWAQIGVKMSIKLISPAAMSNIMSGNPPFKYQMRVNVASSDIIDPDEMVGYMLYGGPGTYAIYTTYNNKQVNSLLVQAGEAQDRATRLKYYYQANRIFHDDAPFVFLYSDDNVTLTSPKVQGFHPQLTGFFRLEEVWLQP